MGTRHEASGLPYLGSMRRLGDDALLAYLLLNKVHTSSNYNILIRNEWLDNRPVKRGARTRPWQLMQVSEVVHS